MWKKVVSIKKSVCETISTLRITDNGDELIVEQKLPDEVDITDKCKLVWSASAMGGNFIKIMYNNEQIGSSGLLGKTELIVGYRLERGHSNACYSTRIFKEL